MDKLEKVIKGLEMSYTYSNVDEDNTLVPQQLILDALALLKAQEPVEPTDPDEDNVRYCGSCGSPVGYEVLEAPGIEYVQYSFCPNCGKAVKWE